MEVTWSSVDRRTIYKRGLMIRGVAAAVFLALFVSLKAGGVGEQIAGLHWLNRILTLLICVNPLLWWIGKKRDYPLDDFRFHWAFDLLAVTAVVYCLGTLDIPISIVAYIIMIVTSATFSTMKTSFRLAAWSAFCLTTLVVAEEMALIPHRHVAFAAHFTPEGKVIILAGSILMFFVFGYLAGTLAEQLREKTLEVHRQKRELGAAYSKEQTAREGMVLLSALVQHDVYSPLAAISGACSEALRSCREKDLAGCGRFIGMIDDRLRSVESAVATLGLFQLGQENEETPTYKLVDVVCELARDLSSECKERNVNLAIEGRWPIVRVKREHAYHVLRNLVMNSIKSVEDNGTGAIVIRSSEVPGWDGAQVLVIDNGQGVSAEARERLFQLSTPKVGMRPVGGLGAGLGLSSNLVRNWGGTLKYEPGDGGGSVFTISVPAERIAEWPG
jgi:signal transduction histidine kinase